MQSIAIPQLNTILPGWRLLVQRAENWSFTQLRWRLDKGALFDSAITRDVLVAALRKQAADAAMLANILQGLVIEPPAPKVRKTRVPISQVKLVLRRQFPTWGEMWKYGFPGGSIEHMRSLGIERDELTGQWFKIEQV